MRRGALLWLSAAACAAALVGWNFARLAHGESRIRTKDLDFLPSPTIARMLAIGHDATVAKLRWIDSFAYFQLQLDRRDDRVAGVGHTGGFQRLYDTLIALDPRFEPIYLHAALCTSGVLKQDDIALGYLLGGTIAMPHDTTMWRNAAALCYANFQLGERDPRRFDQFLRQWESNESDADQRRAVWMWQANLGKRKFAHLEQLPSWFERLRAAPEHSPMGDWIEDEVRQQLGDYGVAELQALADAYRLHRLAPPLVIQDLADPALVGERYGDAIPDFTPIDRLPGGGLAVIGDPWGYPYTLVDRKVVSGGLLRVAYERHLIAANGQLDQKRIADGASPTAIADLAGLGVELPPPPVGGSLAIDDGRVVVRYPPPPGAPYPVRALAAMDAAEQRAALRSALPAPRR